MPLGGLTCSKTLALSTGAVMRVVGTADINPAAANSAVDKELLVLLGVNAIISFLEASYALEPVIYQE